LHSDTQWRGAGGGKSNYVRKGRLVGGFAYVVYPAFRGYSGQRTFIVNNEGIIFAKDLGPKTARLVQQFKTYDPDETWESL
jgi:hypothetical protein